MSYTPIDGPGYEIVGADEGLPPTSVQQLMRARQLLPHNPEHPHSPWDRDDLLVETEPYCAVCDSNNGHRFGCATLNLNGDVIEGTAKRSEPNRIGQPPYVGQHGEGYEEWVHGERWQGLKP